MAMRQVPVLIVGGGPVGLCGSLMLSQHGVRSLLVERHLSTSIFPKARLVNARTMEIFRQAGIEAAVRAVSLSPEQARYLLRAQTLAGKELDRRGAAVTARKAPGWGPAPPPPGPPKETG